MTVVVYLACEDEPARAMGERLLRETVVGVQIAGPIGGKGKTHLQRKCDDFLRLSQSQSLFLLTDLDRGDCAPSLISDWFGTRALPERFLFRVVVREIESWLMADYEGFSAFSGIPEKALRLPVEETLDPKETLLGLIRKHGNKSLKADLSPADPTRTARVGPGYNARLAAFISDPAGWSPARAAENADSLRRTRDRLQAIR
jgi:hypothetical protein